MLSAIILVKDRKENIKNCRDSLAFCDEIVVEVCGLISDYAATRNQALEKAKGDWVLFVDSDELVSRQLAREIKRAIQDRMYSGFYLRRLDNFWGKTLHFGEVGNTKLLRLAKKGTGLWQRKVHEVWHVSGKIGELKSPLLHFPHPTMAEFIGSINHYTDIDAVELSREGKNFNYFRIIANPVGKFLVNYFAKLGFLDGWFGLAYAFMMSLHSLIVRVKVYETTQGVIR